MQKYKFGACYLFFEPFLPMGTNIKNLESDPVLDMYSDLVYEKDMNNRLRQKIKELQQLQQLQQKNENKIEPTS